MAQKPQIIRPAPLGGDELAPREKIMGSGLSDDDAFGDGEVGTPKGAVTGQEASGLCKIEPGVSENEEGGGAGGADWRVPAGATMLTGSPLPASARVVMQPRVVTGVEPGVAEGEAPDDDSVPEEEAAAERDYIMGGEALKLSEDGTMALPIAEKFALALADGFPKNQAWKIAGGRSASYRKRILANPVFRMRVQLLEMERDKLVDTQEGDVFWMVKQNWRLARAGGVVSEIHRATVLLTELMAKREAGPAADVPAAGTETKALPGRPAHQPRALRADASQMRSHLKGMSRPKPPSEPVH